MKLTTPSAIVLAALLLSACHRTCDIDGNEPDNNGRTVVNIILDRATKGATTRDTNPGSTAESNISTLEFFIFDANGNRDALTPYVVLNTYQYKTTINIASSGNVRFVVVANASAGATIPTYADLQARLATREFTAGETTLNHNARHVPAGGFEMSGETVASITAGSANHQVTVGIDRLVSKFDKPVFTSAASGFLHLSDADLKEVWGANTTVTNADMTFACDGYALINGVNKSLLLHRRDWNNPPVATWEEEWISWYDTNETAGNLKYLTSGYDATGEYTNNYSGQDNNRSWFLNDTDPVYVYENSPAIITTGVGKGYDARKVYAFIIKGTLTAHAGLAAEETVTRYWRVNLISGSDYHIYRNKSYGVTITSIKSAGHGTPERAEKNDPIVFMEGETYVDVTVAVNPWEVIVSSMEM